MTTSEWRGLRRMQLLAIFALILACMLGMLSLLLFKRALDKGQLVFGFTVAFVLLCIAAAIAYGSLSVLTGGAS